MMMLPMILPMILPILVWGFLAAVVGYFGQNRKFGFWGYFFVSLFFSPLLGLLLLVASDKRPSRK